MSLVGITVLGSVSALMLLVADRRHLGGKKKPAATYSQATVDEKKLG